MAAIRHLSSADIPQLLHLSRTASWNQNADDWARLIVLDPTGCFGIELDGKLIAATTIVRYPPNLAWLGMVLTLPEFRGRGFARELVNHAVRFAEGCTIRLDASDMGHQLYKSLGFADECVVERWQRDPAPFPANSSASHFEFDKDLDRAAFGADRRALIEALSVYEAWSIPHSGYALGRPGAHAAYFGPCVSRIPSGARQLAACFVTRHQQECVYWDLFPHNREAVAIATDLNFRPVRRLTRMSRNAGPGSPIPDPRIYGIAGFEYG